MAPVTPSIITVIGVGGGGGNAVNHMYKTGIADVSFMVCNTDRQALLNSPIPEKIQLGEGLGAGNTPERGRQAAEASMEQIISALKVNSTRMLFITAGMGGGTGTGAAPVIAKAAKELGILTVAIVTIPFESEGRPRIEQAIEGINTISKCVDSLIIINNAHIEEMYGDLSLREAFGKADDMLATAAKSIADIITQHYLVNIDFADVQKVMSNSGVAVMGSARGDGPNRAIEVAEEALKSPLLHHKDIKGASNVLLNITSGTNEVTMSETRKITSFIQEKSATGNSTDLIWGAGYDDSLGDDIKVTVIATGFDIKSIPAIQEYYKDTLGYEKPNEINTHAAVYDIDGEEDVEKSSKEVVLEGDDNFELVNTGSSVNVEPRSYYQTHGGVMSVKVSSNDKAGAYVVPGVDVAEEVIVKAEHPMIVVEDKKVVKGEKTILDMTDEEMEEIPAWIRRKMQLEVESPVAHGTKTTVNLDLEGDEPVQRGYKTIDLFED